MVGLKYDLFLKMHNIFLQISVYRLKFVSSKYNEIALQSANCYWIKVILLLLLFVKLCAICDPMGYSPPGSSIHGISQASMGKNLLKWVAISFSRGSSQPRGLDPWLLLGRWILYQWATREGSLNGTMNTL